MHHMPIRLLAGLCLAVVACAPEADRQPTLERNPKWSAPQVQQVDGGRYIDNHGPRDSFSVLRPPTSVAGTVLLFWGDQAVARDNAGIYYAAGTAEHEVLMFDADLVYLGALSPQGADGQRLQRPLTVAAGPADRLAAFEAAGTVALFDRWGREFRRIETPFAYATGAWAPDAQLILARSPFSVTFGFEPQDAPLLVGLDPTHPQERHGFGRTREAIQALYTHAANAGSVALDGDGNIYYAALGRAEVQKYSGAALEWLSRREAGFETPEPRLVPNPGGAPRLTLATVQKAIALGPDGLLYVRAAADPEGTRDRLDVLDPPTGEWLRSAPLDTGTAVLIGRRGAAWELARQALLSGRSHERREFRSFALESFGGDSLGLDDLHGKVTLVAFWASWCGPCREELPLLDSLYSALDRPDFAVVGINEDVKEEDGRAFAEELGLGIELLLGRGKMRQRYHYSGLPYSVLLDRAGRIVREYYGFGGREAFDTEVAGAVSAELSAFSGQGGGAQAAPADVGGGHQGRHEHTSESQGHKDQAHGGTAVPAMAHGHHHGPTRPVTGQELERLAAYLPEARRLEPGRPDDIPERHWEIVLDGLAQVDAEVDGFMESAPGTFELVQLMTLKTQLYVDAERLRELGDPQEFGEAWESHLGSIGYLLEAYHRLKRG